MQFKRCTVIKTTYSTMLLSFIICSIYPLDVSVSKSVIPTTVCWLSDQCGTGVSKNKNKRGRGFQERWEAKIYFCIINSDQNLLFATWHTLFMSALWHTELRTYLQRICILKECMLNVCEQLCTDEKQVYNIVSLSQNTMKTVPQSGWGSS